MTRPTPAHRPIHWRPNRWDWRDMHRIVWVSIAKLDASWRKEPALWLPPGSGSRIGRWLAKQSPRCRIIMPVVGWVPEVVRDQKGRAIAETGAHHVVFENGRHRTAWARDHGVTALPVMVHFSVADAIVAELGTSERKSRAAGRTAAGAEEAGELASAISLRHGDGPKERSVCRVIGIDVGDSHV